MKKFFFSLGMFFVLIGITVLGFSFYAFYMTSGFRLLSANTQWGAYFIYYPFGFAASLLLLSLGLLLAGICRSKKNASDHIHKKESQPSENAHHETPSAASGKMCASCNTKNPQRNTFCMSCGQKL